MSDRELQVAIHRMNEACGEVAKILRRKGLTPQDLEMVQSVNAYLRAGGYIVLTPEQAEVCKMVHKGIEAGTILWPELEPQHHHNHQECRAMFLALDFEQD